MRTETEVQRSPQSQATQTWSLRTAAVGALRKLLSFRTRTQPESKPALPSAALPQRLRQHLNDFLDLDNSLSGLNVHCDRVPTAHKLAEEARNIALELSLAPDFDENPVLRRAHDTLLTYWHSLWSNGGITQAQYRLAIKSVLVYIAVQEREKSSGTACDSYYESEYIALD